MEVKITRSAVQKDEMHKDLSGNKWVTKWNFSTRIDVIATQGELADIRRFGLQGYMVESFLSVLAETPTKQHQEWGGLTKDRATSSGCISYVLERGASLTSPDPERLEDFEAHVREGVEGLASTLEKFRCWTTS